MTGPGTAPEAAPRPTFPAGASARWDEPLHRHLPLRTGGPCDLFLVVHTTEALTESLAVCKDAGLRITPLGHGSRTVARDGGLAGAVLRLGVGLSRLGRVSDPGEGGWHGAGAPLAAVVQRLGPDHPLAALADRPGTLGASLAQDDGWAPFVEAVRVHRRGGVREIGAAEALSGRALVVGARLRAAGDLAADAPPPAVPAPWRAFEVGEGKGRRRSRRPEVEEVLDDATLSATRLRCVQIPRAAPAMIVNLGGGTARDLALLQKSAVERVRQTRGVELQDALSWVGRSA